MNSLETGQIWALPADGDIPPILVAIHTLEDFEGTDTVAGIAITPHPDAAELGWPPVSHLPILAKSLSLKTAQLVGESQEPEQSFWEGYNIWVEKFRASEAGVFTMSAADVYAMVVGVTKDETND